jgi:hypothetical protein
MRSSTAAVADAGEAVCPSAPANFNSPSEGSPCRT